MHKIRLIEFWFCFFIFSVEANTTSTTNIQVLDSTILHPYQYEQKGYRIARDNPEEAIAHFEKGISYYRLQADTASALKCVLGMADIAKSKGDYSRSFELLWGMQEEAQKVKDKRPLVELERKVGVLYGFYGKDSVAMSHLKKALSLAKNNLSEHYWASSYLAIAKQYIDLEEYDRAIPYLDSCYMVKHSKDRLIYIDAFYAYVYTKKGALAKAEEYLKGLIPEFQEAGLAFIAKVYLFNADLALAKGLTNEAIKYYESSLYCVDSMTVHMEIKPYLLESLSNLYYEAGDMDQAFYYLQAAKEVSDNLFHTQSEHNKALFEIKNSVQEELQAKERELQAQSKLLSLKDKASRRLQLLILILIVLAVITIVAYRQRNRVRRMLETRKKNEAIIELRNKELTSHALQIIKKDQAVDKLLDLIKKELPGKYKAIKHQYKKSNEKIWDEFHLRFTQTNDAFYQSMLKKHPSLTPNDLRYCVLIKLNFDNSEIAHILNVSLHSVHMARYRIRKKLNIAKEESLTNYITRF